MKKKLINNDRLSSIVLERGIYKFILHDIKDIENFIYNYENKTENLKENLGGQDMKGK
jgi:hypothetical protein